MRATAVVVLAAMFAGTAGCAHAGHKTVSSQPARARDRVADSDFARIPVEQLDGVNRSSNELRQAHNDVLRADQQVTMATQRSEVAKAELESRKADVAVAKQKLELERASGNRARIASAEIALKRSMLGLDLQTAKIDLEVQRLEQAKKAVVVAQRAEDVAGAELQVARLTALKASGDAASDRYATAAFQETLTAATRAHAEAERRLDGDSALRTAEDRVSQAQAALDTSDQQPVRGTH